MSSWFRPRKDRRSVRELGFRLAGRESLEPSSVGHSGLGALGALCVGAGAGGAEVLEVVLVELGEGEAHAGRSIGDVQCLLQGLSSRSRSPLCAGGGGL